MITWTPITAKTFRDGITIRLFRGTYRDLPVEHVRSNVSQYTCEKLTKRSGNAIIYRDESELTRAIDLYIAEQAAKVTSGRKDAGGRSRMYIGDLVLDNIA